MPHVGLFLSAVTCWEQKQLKCHCCHTAMPNSSKDLTEADTPRQIWLVTHASFPSAPCWLKTFTPKAVWAGDGSHSQTKLGSTSSPRSTHARGWLLSLVTGKPLCKLERSGVPKQHLCHVGCWMQPQARFGIRDGPSVISLSISWETWSCWKHWC